MGTPRSWFRKEYPRPVMFTPTYLINEALFRMRGIKPQVFKFDGVTTITRKQAKDIQDIKAKEENIRVHVVPGRTNYVHIQHPLTNVLSVNTPTKPFNEIIDDAKDLTGKDDLFPDMVIHDFGHKFKIPRKAEEYIQGVDTLSQYMRHRGYHTKQISSVFGVRFFKPARIMKAYIERNPELLAAIQRLMRELRIEGADPLDMRRFRSIEETKWIVGDTKGFNEFAQHLLQLGIDLTANKFEQDVAIYHEIANQRLEDHGLEVGGHLYELRRIGENNLYPPYMPLWHEEIPKDLTIK